jgi:LPS-assembly protein
LEYTFSLFDDYLNLSLGEDIYYQKIVFDDKENGYERFRYFSTLNKVKIYSDLTKKYDNFTHVLQPSLEYLKPGLENKCHINIDEFSLNQQKLFDVELPKEHYKLSMSQYFYDNEMNLILYQRLSQKYYNKKSILHPYRFGDLKNELKYNIGNWKIYNEFVYSHYYSKIRESLTYVGYNDPKYNFYIRHTYRDILGDEDSYNLIKANEISFDFDYKYNYAWQFNGSISYNLDESSSKQWRFGVKYKQDCWGVSFEIKQEIIPRPDGSDIQNSFYLMMSFSPFVNLGTSL